MVNFLLHCGTGGALLLIFIVLYHFCFKRSTYLQWNRGILWLMACAVVSLPLIHLPLQWTIWKALNRIEPDEEKVIKPIAPENETFDEAIMVGFSVQENQLTEKIIPSPTQRRFPDWKQLLIGAYALGLVVMLLRFLLQCGSLFKLYCQARLESHVGYTLAICKQVLRPFAFGRTIFISNDLLKTEHFPLVLTHELAHVQQKHSWDILLAEWILIWQWFNPGAWLYRRIVETNLEYLADRQVLQQTKDKKQYQLSLLSWVSTQTDNTLSSSYNFSHLKDRIMMMNRKPSPKKYLLRYAIMGLVLPLFSTLNQPVILGKADAVFVHTTALDQVPRPPKQQVTIHAPKTKMKAYNTERSLEDKAQQLVDTTPRKEFESKTFTLVFSPMINEKEQADLVKSVLAMGKKLEFIRAASSKIIGGKLSTSSDGGGSCSVWHNEEDYELPIVMYSQPGGCSTGAFDESFLDKLINNETITPRLISVGLPKSKAELEAFRPKIIAQFQKENKERLDKLASNNWIESTSTGSTTYRIPIQEKSWENIKNKINAYAAQSKDYIVSIDGQQFQSVLPEVDLAKVKKMTLYEGQRTEYVPGTLKVKHSEPANLRLEIELE